MWGRAYAMSSLPFGLVGPTVIGSVSLGGGARSSPSRRCTDVNRGEVPVQRVEAVNHDTPAPVRRRRRSRGKEEGGRERSSPSALAPHPSSPPPASRSCTACPGLTPTPRMAWDLGGGTARAWAWLPSLPRAVAPAPPFALRFC
jgi:hypothetical protein